jgi:hypothetical protein
MPYAVDRVTVLRDAHRPEQDRRARRRVLVGEGIELGPTHTGLSTQVIQILDCERGHDIRPPDRVGVDEGLVGGTALDEHLQESIGQGHVATGPHRDVQVAHLGAEHGGLGVRATVRSTQLEIGIDHDHLSALLQAKNKYFMNTGWLLAGFDPRS